MFQILPSPVTPLETRGARKARLAQAIANWDEIGFIPSETAARIARLAHQCGTTVDAAFTAHRAA